MSQIEDLNIGGMGLGVSYHNPVERYELMQFTGLRDKNGKEIYEGDLLDPFFDSGAKGTRLYQIVWGHHGFELVQKDGSASCMLFDREPLQHYEIAGNIHETPSSENE